MNENKSLINLDPKSAKRIVKLNFLMGGMEKEKYLKPHFSKNLSPLIKYFYDNNDIFQIPDELKDGKEGAFKFTDELNQQSMLRSSKMQPSKIMESPNDIVFLAKSRDVLSANKIK